MSYARNLKALGMAIAAVLAFSAVATATASAQVWTLGGVTVTKSMPVTSKGKLTLTDTKTVIGSVTVECEGTDEGTVGANGADTITNITTTKCVSLSSGCTSPTAKALNVAPALAGGVWQTQLLKEASGEIRDSITTTSGTKVVGWAVTCSTFLGKIEDKCTIALSSTGMENTAKGVNAVFDALTPNANCTQSGGAATGEVRGTVENVGGEGALLQVA